MESPVGFVEEIDFRELQFCEVVGRGAFGVVSRARWRDKDVAVKLIETESEKRAFITELKQLSRVSHPNIVNLFGACTKQPECPVCLVMEYAEGGSLYNVLHGSGPQPKYTAAHAMSWMLQCARGVEYLHGMKPKPLIHRDLKPPNLLLIAGGTTLKICDFGTACDAQTYMTNNKGSAAWMAPEVFEGSTYSEKCDVFSWGIILWEVVTRRKPFDEIGGPAFRIMWAVHNGTRPPLVNNIPKPLDILMTRCWSANPVERPSIAEVTRIMSHLFQFFKGADVALVYPVAPEAEASGSHLTASQRTSSVFDTPPLTYNSQPGAVTPDSRVVTIATVRDAFSGVVREPVRIQYPVTPRAKPVCVVEENPRRTSAPASLAASRESLLDKTSRCSTPSVEIPINKRYSADISHLIGDFNLDGPPRVGTPPVKPQARGHRRTGSYGNTPVVNPAEFAQAPEPAATSIQHVSTAPSDLAGIGDHQGATGQSGQQQPPPQFGGSPTRSVSWTPGMPVNITTPTSIGGQHPQVGVGDLVTNLPFVTLDHQLQPLAPYPNCPDSMTIFQQHCQLAEEYLKVQFEISLLMQRKHELLQEMDKDEKEQQHSNRFAEDYNKLLKENEQLLLLHRNLKKQVELIRQQPGRRTGGGV